MYKVKKIDGAAANAARERWDSIAKPLNGMGVFEEMIAGIAAVQGTADIDIKKRCVLVMCADNGVVAEGVSQTDARVTRIVTENFASGKSCVCAMARHAGADVIAVDVGVDADVRGAIDRKISRGTGNIRRERAMSVSDARRAVDTGIECVKELSSRGYKIIVTGEMGIGNTTTAAAVVCALTGADARSAAGRGAGLSSEGLERKIRVIDDALKLHRPDKNDVTDVLSKVGGYDIAALAGVFLGGAIYGVTIIIDGFISAAAALCAYRMCPECRDFMIASHISGEKASAAVLKELGKSAPINANMRVGEGTGGVMLLACLDSALAVYEEMATFEEINVERYKELK